MGQMGQMKKNEKKGVGVEGWAANPRPETPILLLPKKKSAKKTRKLVSKLP